MQSMTYNVLRSAPIFKGRTRFPSLMFRPWRVDDCSYVLMRWSQLSDVSVENTSPMMKVSMFLEEKRFTSLNQLKLFIEISGYDCEQRQDISIGDIAYVEIAS